ELPPHRIPTSVALLPLVMRKTGDPLSPPPTPAFTKVWHSCVMFVPETFVFTQVFVTCPCVQPVVRPTLFTTRPIGKFVVLLSCAVTVKVPETVRLPLLGPVVLAITPRLDGTLLV